jgi:hypothetical protein
MRITRDLLLSLARDNAAKMAARDRSLVCVYIVGSLLRGDPFLGEVTDIDLVCVHDKEIKQSREIVRINADIHLDITHLPQYLFDNIQAFRADPWMGVSLDECPLALRDAEHWFDFTRASITGSLWKPQYVMARVNCFAGRARQTWQMLVDEALPQGIKRTEAYLNTLNDAINAVACINGSPLTTRRILLDLPERAYALDMPDLAASFIYQFTNDAFTEENWAAWMPQWQTTFDAMAANKQAPLDVLPTRKNYYWKAASEFAEEHPAGALWIMLRTWTQMATVLPKSEQPYKDWQSFVRQLELDGKGLPGRLDSLDQLLESVELTVEKWRTEHA